MSLADLLLVLEGRLRDQGVPIVEVFAPGVGEDHVRAALKPLGMDPTDEVLTWFAWHNGILHDQPQGFGETFMNWELLSVEQAVATWRWLKPGPDDWDWNPVWLPIANSSGMHRLAAECAPPHARTSRVRMASPDMGNFDETLTPSVATFATAVGWWIVTLDQGGYVWSPIGEWDPTRYGEIPLEIRVSGIV